MTFKYDTNSGKFEGAIGNLKIGKDTLIFNMGSATECASGNAGLCDLFNTRDCYALKAEIQYPATLPARQRQETFWKSADVIDIAEAIQHAFSGRRQVALKYVRVNEAGDMHSRDCLNKLKSLATMLPDIKFYTYTHRSDLVTTADNMPANLVINTSNFEVKGLNQFAVEPRVTARSLKREAMRVREDIRALHGENALTCIGDCSACSLCKIQHGKTIWVPLH